MSEQNELSNLNEEEIEQVAGGKSSSNQIYPTYGSWAPPDDCDDYVQYRYLYEGVACMNCKYFEPDGAWNDWGNCYRDFD